MSSLGRFWSFDSRRLRPRNAMATVLEARGVLDVPLAELPVSKYWPLFGLPLDQNVAKWTNSCVGHAWKHRLRMVPIRQLSLTPTAIDIYEGAQLIDPWAGEEPFFQGTSTEAGAEFCRRKGLIDRYVWPEDMDQIERYLLTEGPIVVGTNWWSGMDVVGKGVFAEATGWLRGGHEYVIDYWNRVNGYGMILNSWGPDGFGHRGRAPISRETLFKLIFRQAGEACAPTETALVARKIG